MPIKGLFIGIWLFSFFTIGYLWFRLFRYAIGGMVDVRAVQIMTIQNWLWWTGLIVCFAVGVLITRVWTPKLGVWILLSVTELIPVGLLTPLILLISRTKQMAGR